jgi:hypothetical protein
MGSAHGHGGCSDRSLGRIVPSAIQTLLPSDEKRKMLQCEGFVTGFMMHPATGNYLSNCCAAPAKSLRFCSKAAAAIAKKDSKHYL